MATHEFDELLGGDIVIDVSSVVANTAFPSLAMRDWFDRRRRSLTPDVTPDE